MKDDAAVTVTLFDSTPFLLMPVGSMSLSVLHLELRGKDATVIDYGIAYVVIPLGILRYRIGRFIRDLKRKVSSTT